MNRFLLSKKVWDSIKDTLVKTHMAMQNPKFVLDVFSSEGSSDILRKTDNKSCYYWKVILVIFYGTEYRRMWREFFIASADKGHTSIFQFVKLIQGQKSLYI